MSEKEHRVSRRQFLNYTLTGVGGFMAAGILMPMTRFALDPGVKKRSGNGYGCCCTSKRILQQSRNVSTLR